MKGSIKVEGLDKLQANLNIAVDKMRRAAEQAVREEVDAVNDDARAAVPVDTGEARDKIQRKAAGTSGTVSATADHSKYIEFGDSNNPPRPFMTPAAARSRARWPKRAGLKIKAALESIG